MSVTLGLGGYSSSDDEDEGSTHTNVEVACACIYYCKAWMTANEEGSQTTTTNGRVTISIEASQGAHRKQNKEVSCY